MKNTETRTREGYNTTIRFLVARGLSYDTAQETAQAAWVKGWELCSQLRDSKLVLTWTNTIALNLHRNKVRREPLSQQLPELASSKTNLASIDVRSILKTCQRDDGLVLRRHYLEGFRVREIAQAQGWTEGAVRIRLLRARRAAGKRLAPKGFRSETSQIHSYSP